MRIVWPIRLFRSRSTFNTLSDVLVSRFPVGSSASSIEVVHNRAGDRHALLFAARQRPRLVVEAVSDAEQSEDLAELSVQLERFAGDMARDGDVVVGGEGRQQVVLLETKPTPGLPHQVRSASLILARSFPSTSTAAGGPGQPAQDVEHGRFPRT
jgi:hypothetical protein